jgi:SAM-dependent methyltransferase
MSDAHSARYDAIPYRHGAVPHSHPARIGAIARLFGIAASGPDECRVLELGCAEGMNLLPLAERLPGARFVGIDSSQAQIATAEAARTACGISNARFVCADLRDFESEPDAFDFIIAHGIYSWVPDDVKDRALAICARSLAPAGVAYMSYNTLPGWGLLSGLREFLLTELARESGPAAQLDHARRVIGTLADCVAQQPGAYAELLRQAFSDMLEKSPALLFHDELGAVSDPCTFLDFAAHAARHGMHWIAEAHFASMPFDHVPAPMRQALAPLTPDILREQQYMDVLFQRWLRSSLLTRAEPPSRVPDPRVVRDCALGLRLRPAEAKANLAPGVPMRFTGPNGVALDFHRPLEKAFLAGLAEAASARVPFSCALERAHQLLGRVGLPAPDADADLDRELLRIFSIDGLDLVLEGDGVWLRLGSVPSALMRYQARHGFALANRWHEIIDLTDEGRHALGEIEHGANRLAMEQAGLLV